MAFSEEHIPYSRWTELSFFASGGANGKITESFAPGKVFKIHELRLHTSIAIASVGDLIMRLSAAKGSAYNMTFISKAMLGSTDVWYLFSNPLIFLSDDQVVIEFSLKSAANVVGINVVGWGIFG